MFSGAQAAKTGKLHPYDRALDTLHHGLGVLVAWGILALLF